MITSQSIMASSLVPQNNPSKPNVSNSPFSARSNRVNIKWPVISLTIYCASRLGSRLLHVVRAEQAPTTAIPRDPEQENQDDKRINSEKSSAGGGLNLPIPKILSWATRFLGSFLVFFPFYKNFLRIEDKIEKTATTVLNAVESVAEAVDKVAEDVQRSLPENSNLMKAVKTVEKFAEGVDNGVEVLESIVEKV
ncbi:hypothetical protein FCM35_KLT08093 [Carex littledalei]|uniref:Uncharacterized protein n=1 Tax=Carex littledalei TaxID=544730 RepID=A0A833QP41_9POAL|nr:hypothetical protein FCM35_KLT08093 [Carex littledalei]